MIGTERSVRNTIGYFGWSSVWLVLSDRFCLVCFVWLVLSGKFCLIGYVWFWLVHYLYLFHLFFAGFFSLYFLSICLLGCGWLTDCLLWFIYLFLYNLCFLVYIYIHTFIHTYIYTYIVIDYIHNIRGGGCSTLVRLMYKIWCYQQIWCNGRNV